MTKINHIQIGDESRYIENISYQSSLPTATSDSADFVSVNNTLYAKQINGTTYSYEKVGGDVSSITITDEVPEATEENFEEGKIYTQGELLKYISKVVVAEPNISQVNSFPASISTTSAAAVGTNVYIFGGRSGSSSSSYVNTIYKYDTTTNIISTMSTTLPVALYDTSAAAVGTDIYVFGGYGGVNATADTIYKYDTTTDTITTMSTTLPRALYGTAAATVGSDVYIFGGSGSSGRVNTVYKYSTTTNTIATMSATFPQNLRYTSAASVGTDIYIFGGDGGSGNAIDTIYKYSTTTNTITTMSTTLPTWLRYTSVAVVGSDVYIFGGDNGSVVNTIYKYSTTTNTIATLSTTLPTALQYTSAAAVGSAIYIFGGRSGSSSSSYVNTIYEVEFDFTYQYEEVATEKDLANKQDLLESDINIKTINNESILGSGNIEIEAITLVDSLPDANKDNFEEGKIYTQGDLLQYLSRELSDTPSIEQVSSLPQTLCKTAAVAVGTDVYILGGYNGSAVNTIYKYDTTINTLTRMSAALPMALYDTSAAVVGSNVYIFGGLGGQNSIYKYFTATNSIGRMSATFPVTITRTSAAAVGTDVYIFGGYSRNSPVNTIYKYSTATNTLTTLSTTLPQALYETSAAVVGTDIYIFGGLGGLNADTIYKYSTTTDTITTMSATLPVKVYSTSASVIGTDVYIFGGNSSSGYVDTIYKYDTTTDTISTMSVTLPTSIDDTSAATVGSDIYVFGGYNGSYANTVYKFSLVSFNYQYEKVATEKDLENKQNVLTAGANIKIENNVISSNYEGVSVSVEDNNTLVFTNINAALTEGY